jgi:hypothetical protein
VGREGIGPPQCLTQIDAPAVNGKTMIVQVNEIPQIFTYAMQIEVSSQLEKLINQLFPLRDECLTLK